MKILKWLDQNIITLVTAILIVAIPLYPKLPVADLIEGYIVRLRAEDLFVALAAIIYFVQLVRGKLKFPQGIVPKLIFGYIVVGFLSSLSAIFITKTVPFEQHHIFKLLLHYGRRIEYFSLFFIAYAGIRTKKDLKLFIITALIAVIGVTLYGFGQKYLYWPAFSTMNREFSKGTRLYLSPTSRVMSTFAGHYDYAAYLMMALLVIIPAMWLTAKKWLKAILGILFFFAYWMLILTASRTSWLGYMAGLTVLAAMFIKIKGFWWSLGRYLFLSFVSLIMLFTMGDLSARFLQLLNNPQAIASALGMESGQVEQALFKIKDFGYKLEDLKKGNLFKKEPPKGAIADSEVGQVATPSDQPPSTTPPGERPPDVTKEEQDIRDKIASESGNIATPSATTGGGYSANALKYGLSAAIRLDVLWPRAIAGFQKNPLLGSGYSTLVKAENEEFTQAESTDNDYLRMLGETGILGAFFFLAIPFYLMYLGFTNYLKTTSLTHQVIYLGIVGAVVGLLINATYIDVFESSKVAYTFWILAAVVIRALELSERKKNEVK